MLEGTGPWLVRQVSCVSQALPPLVLSDFSVRKTRDGHSRVLPSRDSDEVGLKWAWGSL